MVVYTCVYLNTGESLSFGPARSLPVVCSNAYLDLAQPRFAAAPAILAQALQIANECGYFVDTWATFSPTFSILTRPFSPANGPSTMRT